MLYGDYHTHTTYSHGKQSVITNVGAAYAGMLKEIAITDHGFGHLLYGVSQRKWENMRDDVELAAHTYPQVAVYLGVEANLVSLNGDLDLTEEQLERLDILVFGYHRIVRGKGARGAGFVLSSMARGLTGLSTVKSMVKATDAYVRAIERYPVDIVSHPNFGIETDVVVIAEAAKQYGTCLELNGKRIALSERQVEDIFATGVSVVMDSDAHSADRVGDVDLPLAMIDRLGIRRSAIANWDKLPSFRHLRRNK